MHYTIFSFLRWIIILGSILASVLAKKSYEGYSVINLDLTTSAQYEELLDLQRHVIREEGGGDDMHLDILSAESSIRDGPVSIAVSREYTPLVNELVVRLGVGSTVVTDDLHRELEEESESHARKRMLEDTGFDLYKFNTYDQIMARLEELDRICTICEVVSIGRSYEGRDMKLLRIGKPSWSGRVKRAIWLDAGIHAREWLAPATAMYLIHTLADNYIEPELRHFNYSSSSYISEVVIERLVQEYDWYILPVMNPDGYQYTWTENRLWRKTRSPTKSDNCTGTDPNRNWDFHWSGTGNEDIVVMCGDVNPGEAPFSEVEVRNVRDFLLEQIDTPYMYITLHAYGKWWFVPWAYTYDRPDDYEQMVEAAYVGADAIYNTHHKTYQVGTPSSILYKAYGSSMDWAKGVLETTYAYCLELRPGYKKGGPIMFIVPPEWIQPTGEEVWLGIHSIALYLL